MATKNANFHIIITGDNRRLVHPLRKRRSILAWLRGDR